MRSPHLAQETRLAKLSRGKQQNRDLNFALPSSKPIACSPSNQNTGLHSQRRSRPLHWSPLSNLSLSHFSFYFSPLVFHELFYLASRKYCTGLPQSLSYLFGVASIDDYAALRSGCHLTAGSWSRPNPRWSQLVPGETVQVEGIHIVIIDVISRESNQHITGFCNGHHLGQDKIPLQEQHEEPLKTCNTLFNSLHLWLFSCHSNVQKIYSGEGYYFSATICI